MKKLILLLLAVSVLSVCGCAKKSNPSETPAATNAPAMPPPMTNSPAK